MAAGPEQPLWKHLSNGGDYFATYDRGDPTTDWPVTMIFWDDASTGRVNTFYDRRGYGRQGGSVSLDYIASYGIPGTVRGTDRDKGKKDDCVKHRDSHYRVYGRKSTGWFADRVYGHFVVATTHYDYGDGGVISGLRGDGGCRADRKWFGFSEAVEKELAKVAATVPSWKVSLDKVDAKNKYNGQRERDDGIHYYQSNGRASIVRMP